MCIGSARNCIQQEEKFCLAVYFQRFVRILIPQAFCLSCQQGEYESFIHELILNINVMKIKYKSMYVCKIER